MRILSCVLAACAAASFSSVASASVVNEIEPNDSFATAQNLDGLFTTGTDPNVTDAATMPYVSVISGPASSTYDFYRFTVGEAGSYGLFDIDFGMNDFDPHLTLFDNSFNVLVDHDDGGFVDPGSIHRWDSYFGYTFANAGTYFVRVGTCCVQQGTGDYQLNVSLQSPGMAGAVPEPATWAMMLMGFGAAGYSLRRRRPAGKLAHA